MERVNLTKIYCKDSQALVAHTCNPTQEAEIKRIELKPTPENSSQDPFSKIPFTNKG
jgi:hypothetical protein